MKRTVHEAGYSLPSLCVVAPEAYPTLAGLDIGVAGGAELQSVLIARGLAEYGWSVSFIAGDYGQPDESLIGGVRVIRSYKVGYGNRAARYLSDTASMFSAMRRASADVYLQRCVYHQTVRVAAFCGIARRPFVFSAGADANAQAVGDIAGLRPLYRATYPLAMRSAAGIICQNEIQRSGFKRNYGRDAIVLPNLVPDDNIVAKRVHAGPLRTVLWVGSFSRGKRPEKFVELARLCPRLRFRMGGVEMDPQVTDSVRQLASDTPNVDWLGFLSPSEVVSELSRADAFVSTAALEGFPNVFLQAMSAGVPLISLSVDPDGVLLRSGAGVACEDDMEGMIAAIRRLDSAELRNSMAAAGITHVKERHAVSRIIERYADSILAVIRD